jgi:predicted nuclease of predicted toxin-antitoxin system
MLRAGGNEVRRARTDWRGWKDVAILKLAESDVGIAPTLDEDFWQIALQRRTPLEQSGVVLFRVHPATPERLKPLVRAFVESRRSWAGHVSVVADDGI